MPATIALSITNDDVQVMPRLLRYELDFVIPKDAFFRLTDIWDKQGCYVNFHEQEILKFKASAMEGVARYRALDNFGWTLELALPGPTGGEWGYFTSPDKDIIDRVENGLVNYKCPDHQ